MIREDEVKIGQHFFADAGKRYAIVRIDHRNSAGGWDATNPITGEHLVVSTSALLHRVRQEKKNVKRCTLGNS